MPLDESLFPPVPGGSRLGMVTDADCGVLAGLLSSLRSALLTGPELHKVNLHPCNTEHMQWKSLRDSQPLMDNGEPQPKEGQGLVKVTQQADFRLPLYLSKPSKGNRAAFSLTEKFFLHTGPGM